MKRIPGQIPAVHGGYFHNWVKDLFNSNGPCKPLISSSGIGYSETCYGLHIRSSTIQYTDKVTSLSLLTPNYQFSPNTFTEISRFSSTPHDSAPSAFGQEYSVTVSRVLEHHAKPLPHTTGGIERLLVASFRKKKKKNQKQMLNMSSLEVTFLLLQFFFFS